MIHRQSTENGDQDPKTGEITIVQTYVVDTLAECLTCGLDDAPLGLEVTGRPWGRYLNHPTKRLVQVHYKGVTDDHKPGEDDGSMELDVAYDEVAIETHPKIDEIIKKYGGKIDAQTKRVRFPIELPSTANGGSSGTSKSTTKSSKNPMYGRTTFLVHGSIFRRTTFYRTPPSDLLSSVGTFRPSLPRGLPTPKGHTWLIMSPRLIARGNGWSLSEEWKLTRDEPGFRILQEMLHEGL